MNRPAASGLKILLVEDNRLILLAVSYILRSMGHFVTTSKGVDEAISIARTGSIDLMISDLQLADGDGLELIDQIRPFADFPALAMSGRSEMQEMSLSRGYSAFLAKPITNAALFEAIRTVTSGKNQNYTSIWTNPASIKPLNGLSRTGFELGSACSEDLVKTG